jgi:hypothetical protein
MNSFTSRRHARPWCIRGFEVPRVTTGRWETAIAAPLSATAFTPYMKCKCEVAAAQCDWIVTVLLEEPREMVASLAVTGSKAVQQAEARTPAQSSREVHVTMTGDHRWQKHFEGVATEKGPWRSGRSALRRDQLQKSITRPNPRGREAVCHWDVMQKRRGQHDVEMPFTNAVIDVSYVSWEKCRDACRVLGTRSLKEGTMWHDGWEAARQRRSKHFSAARN